MRRSGLGRKSNDVQVMQKDPEDFLCHVYDFAVPDGVGARLMHVFDPRERLFVGFWRWIAEVAEDLLCPSRQSIDIFRSGAEMCEEQIHDDASGGELGRAFVLWIKEHR